MKTLKIILTVICILIQTQTYGQLDDELNRYASINLGQGFNSVSQNFKKQLLDTTKNGSINFNRDYFDGLNSGSDDTNVPKSNLNFEILHITSTKDLKEINTRVFDASMEYGGFEGSVYDYVYKENQFKKNINYLVIRARKELITRYTNSKKLTDSAKNLLTDSRSFYNEYGNAYVTSIVEGGKADIIISFESESRERHEEVSTSLGLEVSGFLGISGDISHETIKSIIDKVKDTRNKMDFKFYGGNIKKLPKSITPDSLLRYMFGDWLKVVTKAPAIIGFGISNLSDLEDLKVADRTSLFIHSALQKSTLIRLDSIENDILKTISDYAPKNYAFMSYEDNWDRYKKNLGLLVQARNYKELCKINLDSCGIKHIELPYPPAINKPILPTTLALQKKIGWGTKLEPFVILKPGDIIRLTFKGKSRVYHKTSKIYSKWFGPDGGIVSERNRSHFQGYSGRTGNSLRHPEPWILKKMATSVCKYELYATADDGIDPERLNKSKWNNPETRGVVSWKNNWESEAKLYIQLSKPKYYKDAPGCQMQPHNPLLLSWKVIKN